jgi:hypothetical protein
MGKGINMNTIQIDLAVKDLVPEAFKNLSSECDYRLTKIENTRPISMLNVGDHVEGPLCIVDVADLGLPGVKVLKRNVGTWDLHYIRTSPIVEVLDVSESGIVFRTEGGTYLLEKLDNVKHLAN